MSSEALLGMFAEAVAATDGGALANLFTAEGVYHDLVYGSARGREDIARFMDRVKRDGRAYRMEFFDILASERLAYCRYRFSFSAQREPAKGRRVAIEGMAQFRLEDGLIAEFMETANQGLTLVQLGLPADSIERALRRWNDTMLADPGMANHLSHG